MKTKYIAIAILLLVLLSLGAGAASAKSLYVNKDLNANSPISAYDIQPAPSYLVWQQTSSPTKYGGAGLGIDTDSETLFVTFEGSGTFDIVDAKTLALLGQVTAPGATNLAGIVVDQDKQKVYTNNREANFIYIYSWNPTTKTLTLDSTQPLVGTNKIYGIALDEVNDVLYVGDLTTTVKSFKTSDWSSAGTYPISQKAMGIAVDVPNKLIYTGNAYPPYGSSGLLSKYDMNTNTETTVNIRTLPGGVSSDNVVGLAVDQDTGLLYITTGNQGIGGSDRIIVFDSNLNKLHSTGDIGNPTGIVVPNKDISYNPLNLAKTDGQTCVNPGDTLTYTISYDNNNPNDVTSVIIKDTLPPGVTFQSATNGGTESGGVVTWNLGTVTQGTSGSVQVTVTVDSSTSGTITNTATIDSDQTPPTTQNDQTQVGGCTQPIPEFPTLAIPVIAILGIMFLFTRRKQH